VSRVSEREKEGEQAKEWMCERV